MHRHLRQDLVIVLPLPPQCLNPRIKIQNYGPKSPKISKPTVFASNKKFPNLWTFDMLFQLLILTCNAVKGRYGRFICLLRLGCRSFTVVGIMNGICQCLWLWNTATNVAEGKWIKQLIRGKFCVVHTVVRGEIESISICSMKI